MSKTVKTKKITKAKKPARKPQAQGPTRLRLHAQVIISTGDRDRYQDLRDYLISEIESMGFAVTVASEDPLEKDL